MPPNPGHESFAPPPRNTLHTLLRHGWVGAVPTGFETTDGGASWTPVAAMPRATNKLRVVREGNRAQIWAIGVDVRRLELERVAPAEPHAASIVRGDVAAGAAP